MQRPLWIAMNLIALLALIAARANAGIVTLDMRVTIDTIDAGLSRANHVKVGDIDRLRVSFDEALIDSKTHRVRLVNFQHLMNGAYLPAAPDAQVMPIADAWLDLTSKPYRLHLRAAVTRGTPIKIRVDSLPRRLTITSSSEPRIIMLAGSYQIDPTPIPAQTTPVRTP